MAKCGYCGEECKRKYCNYDCYWKSKKGIRPKHASGFQKGHKMNNGRKRPDVIERNLKNNPMWKNGKKQLTPLSTVNWCGYNFLYKPDHPNSESKGYVREHRLVMEEKIGRLLSREEVVHHIDENKLNNNIENLKLFKNQSEHMKFHNA